MKSRKTTPKHSAAATSRPKLLPISEEARRWSALLESELLSWPGVIAKRMFGFRALYRGKRIFAALPNSRGFGPDASIILKFDLMSPVLLKRAQTDLRVRGNTPGKGWISFTLASDADLHDALEWLNQAYESGKQGKAS